MVLIVAAFFVGAASNDESGTVSELEDRVTAVRSDLESEESELERVESEAEDAAEHGEELEEQLAAERGFKGTGSKQVAEQEYDTDFPWEAAGQVGYLTMKPVGWEQLGEKWILTVEAKNSGHEPKEPFCGDGGAVVIDAEQNNFSGEAVLGGSSANCGSALQPGQTATYESEFTIPSSAVPVVVALYGDWEQEEEAKQWELPR